jgi:hypothetical protein
VRSWGASFWGEASPQNVASLLKWSTFSRQAEFAPQAAVLTAEIEIDLIANPYSLIQSWFQHNLDTVILLMLKDLVGMRCLIEAHRVGDDK